MAFLRAPNKLLANKDEGIANGYAMIPVLFDTAALETERDELMQETQVVSDMVQQCIYTLVIVWKPEFDLDCFWYVSFNNFPLAQV